MEARPLFMREMVPIAAIPKMATANMTSIKVSPRLCILLFYHKCDIMGVN